ncbi:MAG: RdgB/HAM1 family non-canonical purine NTP pyrophosphatase [Coriobacteriia bacterium]|nr:RdgB/HAM1 family non-canonical purine NTP pyrophosphatase [Coriobacteriia bacterium]
MDEPLLVIVATSNKGKLAEIRSTVDLPGFEFTTAADLGFEPLEVEETGTTFLENARLKARAYAERFGMSALADDSGLQVDALDGEPGVYSSRYAGVDGDDAANNRKLLEALAAVAEPDRTARFRSVVVLVHPEGTETVAEGACEGVIARTPRGEGGFGYDPLFRPLAAGGRTMAELTLEEKNKISHRGAALLALRKALAPEAF